MIFSIKPLQVYGKQKGGGAGAQFVILAPETGGNFNFGSLALGSRLRLHNTVLVGAGSKAGAVIRIYGSEKPELEPKDILWLRKTVRQALKILDLDARNPDHENLRLFYSAVCGDGGLHYLSAQR